MITMQLTYALGNYDDLYKCCWICTNSMIETHCLKNVIIFIQTIKKKLYYGNMITAHSE